jgi:hypothetical protein
MVSLTTFPSNFFILDWSLMEFIMFMKTLAHPHKKCFGRVGIECIILGKPNLHVVVFLEVGKIHLNSIPSHVLSKKFTCMCRHEGPTLSLTISSTFLSYQKFGDENYLSDPHWVKSLKIGLISRFKLSIFCNINIFNPLFLQIELFQSLSKSFRNS